MHIAIPATSYNITVGIIYSRGRSNANTDIQNGQRNYD